MDFIKLVLDKDLGNVYTNASFKDITSIKIGGTIKYIYMPKDVDSLRYVYRYINENNIKHYIVSNGTNILAGDSYFDGIVIYLKNMPSSYQIYEDKLVVDAFYKSSMLSIKLAKLKIGDLSFLAGIPGLIGGAVKLNSGCYNEDISKHLIECKYIDEFGEIKTLTNKELEFSYRSSIFKRIKGIIIEVTFEIKHNIETLDLIKKRNEIKMKSQPLDTFNMGSIFINPKEKEAWRIIDELGYRGYMVNGAKISEKHTNFIVNYHNAKCEDVLNIINTIKNDAKKRYNINLECEINIINE